MYTILKLIKAVDASPTVHLDRGAITTNQVSLSSSSSLMSDPPIFTLFGDTNGGPPTTYTWTRNGQVITNNASYSISIQVNRDTGDVFRDSLYRSTLTVTGVLPGEYQYSVTNRATSGMVTDQMNIEGNPGRNTAAAQVIVRSQTRGV